jgi:predicted transcriptional regulator of viral defense system
MKFETLIKLVGRLGWFDLPTLVQLSSESRASLRMQLHRWSAMGRILPLRRGMYALSEEYRRGDLQPAELANRIYAPSYLSLHWALSYHGMIPEMAVVFTSVTVRQTKRFQNHFGTFTYRRLKRDLFYGCERVEMDSRPVLLAPPEKALLDLWHLESGEWTADRMAGMRFQNFTTVDMDRLVEHVSRARSPRLRRAVEVFTDMALAETEGTVEL